jgi:hypothetical protein
MIRVKRFSLSRRAFLGGAAAVVGLPALESLTDKSASAQNVVPPKRVIAFYVPNGIRMEHWTPAEEGAGYSMTRILTPLESYREKITVVSGLENQLAKPDGPGDHASGTGAFLTCAHPKKTEGADIENGISFDQIAANAVGEQTRIASLQLGIEGGAGVGGCDSGYSCAYARNISWASKTQPLPKTVNPQVLFDQLFQGFDPSQTAEARARVMAYRSSVLDYVLDESNRLSASLGTADRRKLDEYMTGVREIERGLATPSGPECPLLDRPPENLVLPEHVQMMLRLTRVALQCDVTRVVTFMLGNAGSGRSYEFLGVSGGHHQISHHQRNPDNLEKLSVIDTWEVEQLAYLLEELGSIDEVDGSKLVDNTAVFFSSEIEDGDTHAHRNLPVIVAGLGGGLPIGTHVRYPGGTPIANLFVTLLNAIDVPTTTFGDAVGPLA